MTNRAIDIVLGSHSPRRRQILSSIVPVFRAISPHVNEDIQSGEPPLSYSLRISEEKMDAVIPLLCAPQHPALVITADTLVTIDGTILGKPNNHQEAVRFIGLLNGRTHQVITSVTCALLETDGTVSLRTTRSETTGVTFRMLSPKEINDYLESIEYRDKAGSYAFQDNGRSIIESYSGSVTNIIGFPLRLFFSMLSEMGLLDSALAAN